MSLSVQKMVAPLWKWIGTLPLILLFGCGGDNFTPYPEQDGADATIIVHASSTEWDIFLDAQHLGRISWSQPYSIPSGGHVLAVQRARGIATPADRAELPFTIGPGETLEFEAFIDAAGYSRLIPREG
jgi:hypothetical protein